MRGVRRSAEAAREEIVTAVDDVYGWLHAGEIPDTAAWKTHSRTSLSPRGTRSSAEL